MDSRKKMFWKGREPEMSDIGSAACESIPGGKGAAPAPVGSIAGMSWRVRVGFCCDWLVGVVLDLGNDRRQHVFQHLVQGRLVYRAGHVSSAPAMKLEKPRNAETRCI